MLLKRGADVNARGGPYGIALQAASHWGRKKVVSMLIQQGAYVNARKGPYGNTL
jgi:ankyrin repeat protein